MTELQQELIRLVNEVPEGYVVSFGVVAKELMKRSKRTITAQLVGRQLSGMPEHERSQLPWWRVVNKAGYVSALKLGVNSSDQTLTTGRQRSDQRLCTRSRVAGVGVRN